MSSCSEIFSASLSCFLPSNGKKLGSMPDLSPLGLLSWNSPKIYGGMMYAIPCWFDCSESILEMASSFVGLGIFLGGAASSEKHRTILSMLIFRLFSCVWSPLLTSSVGFLSQMRPAIKTKGILILDSLSYVLIKRCVMGIWIMWENIIGY